ncbi:MAG TPA: TetR family transcriptional regulator [Rhodopseudomonas sp.]|uniref:TetR/AcrR family transcriptional regulator n=1 Tax=Rhodopseudomonas sp. TaxID=1078 RepID=UPI002ED81A15
MSTAVDNPKRDRTKPPRSSSAQTRTRVLQVARTAFCQAGFDHVGLREIAARAGTDAAIVIRLFGSKEALFREVAGNAFVLEPAFQGPKEDLGRLVADFLLGPNVVPSTPDDFDAFRFLLRSAASPVAAPILSASLHASFVAPLAKHLGGKDASGRAALLAACVLGLTTMRFALDSPALQSGQVERLRQRFADALQACITQ